MNLFWGVYWAIAISVAIGRWKESGQTNQGGIDRFCDALLIGLFWWLYLLLIALSAFCEWFDDRFRGNG